MGPLSADVMRARQHSTSDALRRTALRYPAKTAVVAGNRHLTYRELDEAATRCAGALTARGLEKGDRLLLLSHNSLEFAVLVFATARIGVVLTPVNFMLGAGEIAFILDDCEPAAVVAEAALMPTAAEAINLAHVSPRVRAVAGAAPDRPDSWEDVAAWLRAAPLNLPEAFLGDDDPVQLLYTSGTESRPKGVLLPSRSLISQYVSCIVDGGMAADDIEVHAMPLFHSAQLDCFFSVDVYLGATSVILPGPEPAALLEAIETHRATKLFCPPTVWISLLRHPDFDRRDLSSLVKGYYGASAMPVEILRELQERLPKVDLWNFYGQTELAPVATILKPEEQLTRAGSAGRPVLNVETRVVDDDNNPLPPGQVGEIVHRSPQATLGYFRDEAKTSEAFRDGWFHSGDLGVFDEDGYLTVVDRKKDMIKTGGENVASREVEEAIYLLDGVAEVAVFGVPDPRWIEAVVAAVVPKKGADLTVELIRAHLVTRLAGFKRPKQIILTSTLPKSASGKILKRELREATPSIADDAV